VTVCPPRTAGSGKSTIGDAIQRRAELQPDHAAIVATGFAPLSYRELQSLIQEVRAALRAERLGSKARIAIAIPNGPQAALAIVAVSSSAVSIPINPKQTLREIEICLTALQPDAVLLINGADSIARQVAKKIGVKTIEAKLSNEGSLGFTIVASKTAVSPESGEFDEPHPDAPAFILQTSGTTSEPKLIPFSHRNMIAAANRLQTWFNLTPQDRCLSVSPVFYSHGLKVTVFTPLLSGGTVAFTSDASSFDFAEWFGFLKPTWYSAGPTLHRLIFDQTQWRADAKTGHSLRYILSGGAPLPRKVLEGLQDTLGVPVVEHYGSSEAAQIAANLLPPGRSKLGTCGIPWPDTVRIVGEDGLELPAGEEGEVLVSGPTLMAGYLNAPELNRACFIDGWFKTGDIGAIDKDGFLTLMGRKNDIINRGGEKISPIEIDDVLMSHPTIAEAAAFSIPHARLGEDVAAAVVLRPGMTATPTEIRRYLQDKVASFKVPRRIIIRDQLPKGKTGKVQRRRLTDSWEEMIAALPRIQAPQLVENAVENGLVSGLLTIWERLLKTTHLSVDDDFFDKGGDSLLAAEMLVDLESMVGETIPGSILFEATTVRQLSRKLSQIGGLQQKNLIKMNSGGKRLPLIYFHGNFNAFGRSAITLAKILGPNQPVIVIAPHGTDAEPIPRSIEAMAADRLSLILDAQPEGPYRLGGKCLGGIVAFEVARLLVNAGKEVEMVVMLDPPTINARKSIQFLFSMMGKTGPIMGPVLEHAMAWAWFRGVQLQRFWNYPWSRRGAAIRRRLPRTRANEEKPDDTGNSLERAAPIIANGPATQSDEMLAIGQFTDARTSRYAAAMSNYLPTPLAVRIVYVKVDFGIGAWRRLSPDVEVVTSPGTHEFIDFADVAEHLRMRL
jgi:acyl-CoA synthetase (AMP-forming)/AMP-acid ligase II